MNWMKIAKESRRRNGSFKAPSDVQEADVPAMPRTNQFVY